MHQIWLLLMRLINDENEEKNTSILTFQFVFVTKEMKYKIIYIFVLFLPFLHSLQLQNVMVIILFTIRLTHKFCTFLFFRRATNLFFNKYILFLLYIYFFHLTVKQTSILHMTTVNLMWQSWFSKKSNN
mgnify:CR=1 FL=1